MQSGFLAGSPADTLFYLEPIESLGLCVPGDCCLCACCRLEPRLALMPPFLVTAQLFQPAAGVVGRLLSCDRGFETDSVFSPHATVDIGAGDGAGG
ncbi:hypothetical protein [Streptomyces sp. IBSBF 3136]|uniref:hypothetical protein n=1 Tax=Streptomyces sp. IBSBF 3136 TaxID=2903524 RepID=UPI002FDBA3EA